MHNGDQKTVLVVEIVEDEPSYHRILSDKLVTEGFGVVHAGNGEEGLASALEKHPDVILLDIMMPVMDGITMLKKLRTRDEWGKTVPVFILTNVTHPDNETMQALAEFTPTYFFEKASTSIDELVAKIREQFGTQHDG